MTDEQKRACQARWDSMTLSQLREHAGWMWYDYTHGTNIRHAPPSRTPATAARAELRRREKAEGDGAA